MMSEIILFLLLAPLLVAIAAVGLLRANLFGQIRRRFSRRSQQAPVPPQTPATGTTRIRSLAALQSRMRGAQPEGFGMRIRTIVVGLGALAIFAVVVNRVIAPPSLDEFTVLVAPFQEPDGSVTQTGRSAADRLVAILPETTDGRVRATLVDAAPASDQERAALLQARGADVLVWGTIETGAMLDTASLTPQLAYQPTGAYAPNVWKGYTSRFVLPLTYQVSAAPVNGAAVLPRLFAALADYGADRPDAAVDALRRLLGDYPMLNPTLPQQLIGNALWARGDTAGAANAYRRAIASAATTGQPPQAALLYNNLGVILFDAGDLAARDAYNQAIGLLNASQSDLGELRYNLALASLAAGDLPAALASFDQARKTLRSPSASFLLDLSAAYRDAGLLSDPADTNNRIDDEARSVLVSIERQIVRDIDRSPPEVRDLASSHLRARYTREEALLNLASLAEQRGPLLWGLESRNDLSQQALSRISDSLDGAVQLTEKRVRSWSTRAAAHDAAGRPLAGLIAAQQARLAERDLRDIQGWHAATLVELGESQMLQPPQGIASIWSGWMTSRGPLAQANELLDGLIEVQPRDVELLIVSGHNLLDRRELEQATARFNAADALDQRRPEPPFGLALVRLSDQQADEVIRRSEALALLQRSLERNPSFYPARIRIADLAEESSDWPTALEQRRQLVAEQPGPVTELALARTLRRSGTQGFVEAESLLIPLANSNNIDALVELAELYGAAGDPAAQRMVLEKAQRLSPRNIDVAYDLGALSANQGDRSEAERQFKIALAGNRAHIPSLLAMGQLSAGTDRAAEYYRSAIDSGANDVATLKRIGNEMLSADQDELALLAFSRAASINAQDAEAQYGRARASLRLGRIDDAEQSGITALDLRGGNYPDAQIILGDVALTRNQPDAAIERYTTALSGAPSSASGYIGRGRAYALKGDWASAASQFQSAIAADPRSAEAQRWLGEALLRQGNPAGAAAQYQLALQIEPDSPEAHFGLAQAQLGLNQVVEAEANLDAAIQERPGYAEALLLQGKLYEQTARNRKALASYEAAIAANRQLPEPHYRRALLLIQEKRLDEAKGELETALVNQPNFPEAHYWIGRVAFAKGEYLDALVRFQRAIELAGNNYPDAQFYQGLTQEQLGQEAEAIASFQSALERDAQSPWADEARAALVRLGQQ